MALLAAQGMPPRIGWLLGGAKALTSAALSADERRERALGLNDLIQEDIESLYALQVRVQIFAGTHAAEASQSVHGHLSKLQTEASTLIQEFCSGPADLQSARELEKDLGKCVAEVLFSNTYPEDHTTYQVAVRKDLGTDQTPAMLPLDS